MPGTQLSTRRLVPARLFDEQQAPRARRRFGGAGFAHADGPRPLGVGEILDRALDALTKHFALCVGLAFLASFPLIYGMRSAVGPDSGLGSDLFWAWLAMPIQVLTTGLICAAVGPELLGGGRGVRLSAWALLGVVEIAIVTSLGAPLIVCCFLPLVVYLWWLSVAPMVFLLEQHPAGVAGGAWVIQSLLRSARLVQGGPHLMRWVGFGAVRSVLLLPLNLIDEGLSDPELRRTLQTWVGFDGAAFELFEGAMAAFFFAIGSAFSATLLIVFYSDLRVRKEGLDLERTLERISSAHDRVADA